MIRLNLALLLSLDSAAAISGLANLLDEAGVRTFVADSKLPHCTLYMTEFDEYASRAALRVVSNITKEQRRPIMAKTRGIELTEFGWWFLNLTVTQDIESLANRALAELSPLRTAVPARPTWLRTGTRKERFFQTFGSPNVLEEFEPHLTLAKASPLCDARQLLRSLEEARVHLSTEVQFDGLILGAADENGQLAPSDSELFRFGKYSG